MIVYREAPAKINLWLEIVGKRPDGYHDLSSLMIPVRLHDRLWLELREAPGISMECDEPGIPVDHTNLCWKAAEAFFARSRGTRGAHIKLEKDIPFAAGLGGGSSDAAAVLLALGELTGSPLGPGDLHDVARSLGADVPFFLYGRPALATGIGEKLEPVEGLPEYQMVLIKPPVSVSTRWAYESLKLTRQGSQIKIPLFLGRPLDFRGVLQNDLETVTEKAFPVIREIKEWLYGQGALGALMSGSGPTVFGIFAEEAAVRKAADSAGQIWKECWVARTSTYGGKGRAT